jgi:hypothetical protein
MAEQDTRMVNQAYEKFVNAVANNPSSFHQELEHFAPVVLQGVRVAFKTIPPLRRSVVNLIGRLLEKLLGRWIPKQHGSLVYRPLANLLLKLMGLEATSNVGLQNRVFAEAIGNTAMEALVTAANLPESLLESDQQVLESELESIVQQSVLNNIPGEGLGESFAYLRRIRGPLHFVSKRRYQYLNRPLRVRLSPRQINTIKVRGGVFFGDFLRSRHMWNGRSSMTVELLIFRTIPGRGRISSILRGYFGRGRRIRLTPFHFRQLHPMTTTSSRILKVHNLYSKTMPTYFLVSKVLTGAGKVITAPRVVSNRESLAPLRSNDVSVKIDTLGRLRASVYLNHNTVKILRSLGPNVSKGLNPLLTRLVSSGRSWVANLLTRLRMPRRIARTLAGLLLRIALRYFRRAASNIIQKIRTLSGRRGGVTISLIVRLPRNIVRTLVRVRPTRLLFVLRSLTRKISYSVVVNPGYRI